MFETEGKPMKVFDVSACLADGDQISLGLFEEPTDAQDYARQLNGRDAERYRRLLGITRFRIQPRNVTPRKAAQLPMNTSDENTSK